MFAYTQNMTIQQVAAYETVTYNTQDGMHLLQQLIGLNNVN